MVLVLAQPVDDYLQESGSCPVINRKDAKRVLRVFCSLVHFCDSHYSMYNGLPHAYVHGVGCPRHNLGPSNGQSIGHHHRHYKPHKT